MYRPAYANRRADEDVVVSVDRIRGPNTEERFDLEGRKPIFNFCPALQHEPQMTVNGYVGVGGRQPIVSHPLF